MFLQTFILLQIGCPEHEISREIVLVLDFWLWIQKGFVPIVSCCCLNSFRRPLAFTTSLGLYIAIRHA